MADELEVLLGKLCDPWASRCWGLFTGLHSSPGLQWNEISALSSVCIKLCHEILLAELAPFTPQIGFDFTKCVHGVIHIPRLHLRLIEVQEGSEFICCGRLARISETSWKAPFDVVLNSSGDLRC